MLKLQKIVVVLNTKSNSNIKSSSHYFHTGVAHCDCYFMKNLKWQLKILSHFLNNMFLLFYFIYFLRQSAVKKDIYI
jgi:hypothetical protein